MGETPPLDLEAGGDQVSIPSPFPSFFGDDAESSPLEEGVPMSGIVVKVVDLEDVEVVPTNVVRPVENLGKPLGVGQA